MRRRLIKWLACPLCHSTLNLIVKEVAEPDYEVIAAVIETKEELEEDILAGALTCGKCGVYFPVYMGIPRLLTYATEVAEIYRQKYAGWISQKLSDFAVPDVAAPPGEQAVLRNFSREWTEYEWTGDSYWDTTPENMLTCMRYVLGIPRHGLAGKLALEVGIGIGGIANALTLTENCEIVGMDLGYAVDQARHYFGQNPRLHIIQASIFAPPFRDETFDVVYSHGVLHHTYSTVDAFRKIARLPRCGNGMLCIWVYSHEEERSTVLRRLLMGVERVTRPIISRLSAPLQTFCMLPSLPFYIAYQNLYRRKKMGAQVTARYGWNEALHAARDRLTPFFAHRHSYEEVAEWFREEKYGQLEFLRDEPRPISVSSSYSLNVGIRGVRLTAA